METETYKYLRFVQFEKIFQWDLKRYLQKTISSKYAIDFLGSQINEESQKYRISEKGQSYGILGVNNQIGIFDAYHEDGAKIKQKYKKMETGWIAYNPYRVNVGSVGIKKDCHQCEYISPAYVVFSCKTNLLPDYLFLMMKTPHFNQIIRDNTTGSVRQNLSFDILSDLQIPLPSLPEQEAIVAAYNAKIAQAATLERQATETEAEIERYLLEELGVENTTTQTTLAANDDYKFLRFVEFEEVERWDIWTNQILSKSSKYETTTFSKIVKCKPKYGAAFSATPNFNGYRYVRITDINEDGSLNDEIVSATQHDEQYILKQNDFLIARSGSVGKTFLYDEKMGEAIYAGYLIKFEFDENQVNLQYLLFYTKSSLYKKWINSNVRVAVQLNINSNQYLNSPIILPPLSVQNALVEHISTLKDQIKTCKMQATALRTQALADFEKEIFE